MTDENSKVVTNVERAWPSMMRLVGSATALIGLFASIAGGITWVVNNHRHSTERQSKLALAQAQANQREYRAAIESYDAIIKQDPLYRPAIDQQLDTAFLWDENFSVLMREGQNASDIAGPELDEMMAVLDSGLARTKGMQLADVQAHIGWAHWLNQHIAEREFGNAAEQNFRAALATDPTNVYANAMLGNWELQNAGNFDEAIQHFNIALKTGKVRPFVRSLQLGGMIHLERKGARREAVEAANDMRKAGEFLDPQIKSRIVGFCFDPVVTEHDELSESLTAAAPEEVWQTYLWLDDAPVVSQDRARVHDFINANLLEIAGKRQDSLAKYRELQQQLKGGGGEMKDSVNAAVARLSHP
jgi:tetratricopeptide (TPR) repeat protein